MKSALIAICNIAFVLFVLSAVLYQTANNYSQQSEQFYSSGAVAGKPLIEKNKLARYAAFSQEDRATRLLITEGSSSTEGYGVTNEYSRQLAVLFGGNYYKQSVNLILDSTNLWAVRNVGNGGDTMIQMTAQYAAQVLPFYNPSLSVNYLTLQGGSNDVANGRTVEALKADVAAYVAKAKADGFRVGVCTIFHRVGNEVGKVSDYNNWLRAGKSGADFIVDLAADPLLSDANNLTYFQGDGIHPNNAGQTVIAGIFANSIPTLGVASVVATIVGRVTDANGEAIEGATIKIIDSQGSQRTVITSSSGKYLFDNCQIGETYTLSISDNRYSFVQPWQILIVNNAASEVNFTALPITKLRKRLRSF